MTNIDELIKTTEKSDMDFDKVKQELANAIIVMWGNYLYSIDKDMYWRKRLRTGPYLIKSKMVGGGDYSDPYPIIRIYHLGKLIIKIEGQKVSEWPHKRRWTSYNLDNIKKFNNDKLVEIQEFHNSLVLITQHYLTIKNIKLDNLNNFQLALKELEV